jgi:hypothetical protein
MSDKKSLALVRERPKPELIKIKDRSVSGYGFRHILMKDHLNDHLLTLKNWCEVRCLARTMYGRDTPNNRAAIRKRLSPAIRHFLKQNMFLVVEYEARGGGHRGEAKAMKIYTPSLVPSAEQQYAISQLERMRKRNEITTDLYQAACQILGVQAQVP